jgi:hypothetical protein
MIGTGMFCGRSSDQTKTTTRSTNLPMIEFAVQELERLRGRESWPKRRSTTRGVSLEFVDWRKPSPKVTPAKTSFQRIVNYLLENNIRRDSNYRTVPIPIPDDALYRLHLDASRTTRSRKDVKVLDARLTPGQRHLVVLFIQRLCGASQ